MISQPVQPLAAFDRVRIISLPARHDRQAAVRRELAALGHHVDDDRIAFFSAVRPTDPAGFDSIGAHGCFRSHLDVLREARAASTERLLVLEDDVAFSRSEKARLMNEGDWLARGEWDIFHGGSPVPSRPGQIIAPLDPSQPAMLTHFIAFSAAAIDELIPYLEAMLTRSPGDTEGGPMHVDGAYSWFRRAHPAMRCFAAAPGVAHQRASNTDIHQPRAINRIGWLNPAVRLARGAANMIRGLT